VLRLYESPREEAVDHQVDGYFYPSSDDIGTLRRVVKTAANSNAQAEFLGETSIFHSVESEEATTDYYDEAESK
jgi:hypothetical protein